MTATGVPVLEIGGTHVTAAMVDTDSWTVVRGTSAHRVTHPDTTTEELVQALVDAAAVLPVVAASPWGVAVPGPFDYARGVADFHGVGKFDRMRGVDLGAILSRSLPGSPGALRFVNDAEAFAVGEWVAGAGRGHQRMIGITLGTGVGSAFLVDGRAQAQGPGIPREGRVDLLEVAGHPLEDTVSRRAIRARYESLTGVGSGSAPDVLEIAARARAGDRHAESALHGPILTLGRLLGPRVVAFGASRLVVGGAVAQAWDLIEGPLRTGVEQGAPGRSPDLRIDRALRIDDAALIGAARHAIA